MKQHKQSVAVYVGDKDTRVFLERFFNNREDVFSATFHGRLPELRKNIRNGSSHILVVDSPTGVGRVRDLTGSFPTLAMISSDRTEGIRTAVKHGIERYLIAPYYEEDLECKLKLVSEGQGLIEAFSQEKKDLEAVADLVYLLSSTLDPRKVLFLIVKRLSELLPVSRCSILSVEFGDTSQAKVVTSFENPSMPTLLLDMKKYPEIRKALRTHKTVVVRDALTDPLMKPVRSTIAPLGIKSIIVMPVVHRSEVIGTLFLRTSSTRHAFTEREIGLCRRIARASANALYNAFLFEEIKAERAEMEEMAITDFLTGLYNIRYLYHRLDAEFSRSQRYAEPLGCLMIDLDHFKRINDIYGHRTGDMVLREFADMVRRLTRKSDVLARYGGEEFCIVLPNTSLKGAASKARRLVSAVREHRFRGLSVDDRLTISIGVAGMPDLPMKTRDDLITSTDSALLRAKKNGRDRVEICTEYTPSDSTLTPREAPDPDSSLREPRGKAER